jgi:hypothetical protein
MTLYKPCRRNSVVKKAKKQWIPQNTTHILYKYQLLHEVYEYEQYLFWELSEPHEQLVCVKSLKCSTNYDTSLEQNNWKYAK